MARVQPTTSWIWVRHAPAINPEGGIYGNKDVPADCQADQAFDWLADHVPCPDVLVTSHLCRTHQTADALNAARLRAGKASLPARLEERDLGEQNFGAWQGQTYAQIRALNPEQANDFWLSPADKEPPGGESFAALSHRVSQVIERLTAQFQGKTILSVTHGGTIRAALGHALALAPKTMLGFAVDNLSITRLDHFAAIASDGDAACPAAWRVSHVNLCPGGTRA